MFDLKDVEELEEVETDSVKVIVTMYGIVFVLVVLGTIIQYIS